MASFEDVSDFIENREEELRLPASSSFLNITGELQQLRTCSDSSSHDGNRSQIAIGNCISGTANNHSDSAFEGRMAASSLQERNRETSTTEPSTILENRKFKDFPQPEEEGQSSLRAVTNEVICISDDEPETSTGPFPGGKLRINLSVRRQSTASCDNLIPVRDVYGKYRDSNYSAMSLRVHNNPTSIPILDSDDDGVLHVVTGWDATSLLSDLCYRFEGGRRWKATRCDFLQCSYPVLKAKYQCKGVLVCPLVQDYDIDFSHGNEAEWALASANMSSLVGDISILQTQIARNLYLTLNKENTRYCSYKLIVPETNNTIRCPGKPKMRKMRSTGELFVGCSHYHLYPKKTGTPHRFVSLRSYDDEVRSLLSQMLEKGEPVSIPGDTCTFMIGKKCRNTKKCPIHQLPLVEIGGNCPHTMFTVERQPLDTSEIRRDECSAEKAVYALCHGRHNHPPPPQSGGTSRKSQMFHNQAIISPDSSAAVLRVRTQQAISSDSVAPSMTNLHLNKNMVSNSVQRARRSISTHRDDFTSLFHLSSEEPYILEARFVSNSFIFLLSHEEQLERACKGIVFGADSTYKTVSDDTKLALIQPNTQWYLYNIVAPNDPAASVKSGIVVARALMTSQTIDAYAAVWNAFLRHLKRVKASMIGMEVCDIAFELPYMPLEPDRRQCSIPLRAITTDFEIPEIKGIASAISNICGGSVMYHISHLFIGCHVHFRRAVLKKRSKLDSSVASDFENFCNRMHAISNVDEASGLMARIISIDPDWGTWASSDIIRPLISPAFSNMSPAVRSSALQDTNIVESQNRKGHAICGIQQSPILCVQKLRDLDKVSISLAASGIPRIPAMRSRPRVGFTLCPATQQTQSRKRSRIPPRGKTKRAKRRLRSSDDAVNEDCIMMPLIDKLTACWEKAVESANAGWAAFLKQIQLKCTEGVSIADIRSELKSRLREEIKVPSTNGMITRSLTSLIKASFDGEISALEGEVKSEKTIDKSMVGSNSNRTEEVIVISE